MPNRLSQESSPYLRQHANNPVDWYPWGEEAFEKARKEDKPILVSIGYSTCHWCHVMERESFENEQIAAYMNAHFVNIKVDREERPDVDQIYMDAIQVLSGSGGWPLNCFLTPDLKPFYGGTYFPPKPAYGRVSWSQLLMGLADSYHNKRSTVEEQANRLIGFIEKADDRFINVLETTEADTLFTPVWASNAFHAIMKSADVEEGGFGAAPKFPATMTLTYLLDYHYYFQEESALQQLQLSLQKMIYGGIYDQLGGGFARYSTDKEWLAPHFEKMLYDNALLVSLLSKTYLHTGEELYRQTIDETLGWVLREMKQEEGGFYTALDADSEGVEGKFYVWDAAEVQQLLGDDAPIFNTYYDVSPQGNWEGKNILRRRMSLAQLAEKIGWEPTELQAQMERWKTRLLLEREKRIRPGLDDKVLLDWNALMCTAFCDAYLATDKEEYLTIAKENISFIYNKMKDGEGFYHSYKEGKAQYAAFLNDYAYLIQALIRLYQISFEECYLKEAQRLMDYTIQHFKDKDSPTFYYTAEGQTDILVRKRDLHDNALPSGNAIMLGNLQELAVLLGETSYKTLARDMLTALSDSIGQYPRSFSQWACYYLNEIFPIQETAVVGTEALTIAQTINKYYIPNKTIMASLEENETYPLLANRAGKNTLIYLCTNFTCQKPVTSIEEYLNQLLPARPKDS